jgi:HAD superfamily hydrolase (TIGR01549 family)
MRNKASEYIEQRFDALETEKFKLGLESFLSKYEQDSARKSVLFPDTIPALDRLRELGARIGLVTNTSAEAVDVVFELHDLRRFFGAVITRDNVRRLKPDPEGVLLAVQRLGSNNFLMVGDLILDVLAARAANGVAVLLIRHGQSNPEDLFKHLPAEVLQETKVTYGTVNLQADYVIESLVEVPPIVEKERSMHVV